MGSLFKKKQPRPAAAGGPTPEGRQHEKVFALLCQSGDDGNKYLEAGMPGRSQREYLKLLWYLGGSGLIDQYILGKAFLGLMAVESLKPSEQNALSYLVKGPPPGGFGGPMEVVGALHKPAHHCFQAEMLSEQDQKVYQGLLAHVDGAASPPLSMSPWDTRLARAPQFPVLHIPTMTVACVIEKDAPPPLAPELEGQELHVEIPGMA